MAQRSRVCSCGRIVPINGTCSCKKKANNEAKRRYYEQNKDLIKPLKTARWRKLRSLIIKRDNGCCQRCLIKYGIINTENLEVHHIKPRSEYPELMFEESNLITLCKTCNLQLGTNGLDFEPRIDLKNTDFDFKL
jgi:5-methylcytosine-specific restriction endonuclease McrA